jgi:predicted phage baseplate assembly protein
LVLTGGEALALQNNLPLPDPLEGDTLILAGLFPNLQDGQAVVVQGNQFDPTGQQTTPTPLAEYHTLSGKPLLDSADNLTTVTLDKPLANQYARAGGVLLANVAAFTQGETVKDEILGSGNSTPLQSYPLKKTPLTYLPSTDPEGLSSVESTLTVTVNGVRWQEQPSLVASAPADQVFTTTLDDTGVSTVVFGDGTNGAAPPTGVNNIHARYRKGLGISGNVATGAVQQLIDSVAGVQQVTNPQPTAGGADPESIDRIRINAPASVRTFGRAVSAEDYAALALTFPGIAKASASWIGRDQNLNSLAQPYVQLTVATAGETPILGSPLAVQLRNFLDKRRDPNVPIRILDFTPVYVDVAVTVDLLNQYPRQATFAAVLAALNPGLNADGSPGYFAFQNLGFGQNLHLSEVYAVLQSVPGVSDSNITTFRRMDLDGNSPSTVRTDIFIGPTEIAVIGGDPSHPEQGLVTLNQGTGGFVDS